MYAYGGHGGSGGGFRSAHQSGSDGPSRGGRGVGAAKRAKPKMRVACSAEVAVPEVQRAIIIGRGGATIKERLKSLQVMDPCSEKSMQRGLTTALTRRSATVKATRGG